MRFLGYSALGIAWIGAVFLAHLLVVSTLGQWMTDLPWQGLLLGGLAVAALGGRIGRGIVLFLVALVALGTLASATLLWVLGGLWLAVGIVAYLGPLRQALRSSWYPASGEARLPGQVEERDGVVSALLDAAGETRPWDAPERAWAHAVRAYLDRDSNAARFGRSLSDDQRRRIRSYLLLTSPKSKAGLEVGSRGVRLIEEHIKGPDFLAAFEALQHSERRRYLQRIREYSPAFP